MVTGIPVKDAFRPIHGPGGMTSLHHPRPAEQGHMEGEVQRPFRSDFKGRPFQLGCPKDLANRKAGGLPPKHIPEQVNRVIEIASIQGAASMFDLPLQTGIQCAEGLFCHVLLGTVYQPHLRSILQYVEFVANDDFKGVHHGHRPAHIRSFNQKSDSRFRARIAQQDPALSLQFRLSRCDRLLKQRQ